MDAKKATMLVGVTLVLFFVVTQPAQASEAVATVLTWLKDGTATIVGFIRELAG